MSDKSSGATSPSPMTDGFRPSCVYVVAAQLRIDKTAVAQQIATELAASGTVAFPYLEISGPELVVRLVAESSRQIRVFANDLGSQPSAYIALLDRKHHSVVGSSGCRGLRKRKALPRLLSGARDFQGRTEALGPRAYVLRRKRKSTAYKAPTNKRANTITDRAITVTTPPSTIPAIAVPFG